MKTFKEKFLEAAELTQQAAQVIRKGAIGQDYEAESFGTIVAVLFPTAMQMVFEDEAAHEAALAEPQKEPFTPDLNPRIH